MKVIDVDNSVWERKRPLDKEVADLLKEAANWPIEKTKEVEFEKPQKSLKAILEKAFSPRRLVLAKKVDKDPKRWHIMLRKVSRKRVVKTPAKAALNGTSLSTKN